MLITYALLLALCLSAIKGAVLSWREIAKQLIEVDDEHLGKTFKELEGRKKEGELSEALTIVAQNKDYVWKVSKCLEFADDPYKEEALTVSWLVYHTLFTISWDTRDDPKAFANIVASFQPTAIKPIAIGRYHTLRRMDARDALEEIMNKSPVLITDSLSKWLASHIFDQKSKDYALDEFVRKQAFEYLLSFATESTLGEALDIAKSNEHYMMDSEVLCCDYQDPYPDDLISKLEDRLEFVQKRSVLIDDTLTFWPAVLIPILEEYLGADYLLDDSSSDTAEVSQTA